VTAHAGAGSGSSGISIFFFDGPQSVNPFPLVVTDPLAATPAATQFESQITTLDIANVSEWFPDASGNATAWGIRYRVYAKGNNLYAIDLRKSGSPPPTPKPTQLSMAAIQGVAATTTTPALPALCFFDYQVFDNYRSADQSWIVFHARSTSSTTGNGCGSLDDQFLAVETSMGATNEPLVLTQTVSGQSMPNQLQPVEALYDKTGLITGFLAISHPPENTTTLQPTTPVAVVQLSTGMTVTKTFAQTLTGSGLTGGSGDFVSLGVSAGGIWLYKDPSGIWAVDVANNVSTRVYTIKSGDVVHGRAVFDGAMPTKAYISIDNAAGSYVLQIDTSTKTSASQPPDTRATLGIELVGVSSANVVYVLTDRSAVKALSKTTLSSSPFILFAASGTLSVDGPQGSPNGAAPVAYLVQDEVYFTAADVSNGNKLAYVANAGATPRTAAVVGTSSGAVLGTIAGTFATSGAIVNSGALVATAGAFNTSLTFSGGTLSNYGPTGTQTTPIKLGTLPTTIMSLAPLDVSTLPMQAGVPAMLEMTGGLQTSGQPVNDVGLFTPNAAASFKRVTSNLP
jgi:hypothetical protein